jgi:ATP-dependent Clp protease, protease subunit
VADYRGFSDQTSTLMLLVASAFGWFFYVLGGLLGERVGRQRALVGSAVLLVALAALWPWVTATFARWICYFFIYQFSNGTWSGVGYAYWAESFPTRMLGTAIGWLGAMFSGGLLIGSGVWTALIGHFPPLVPDWLGERMAAQRVVMLSGVLDRETANRAVATLALCDATGDDPVQLRLADVSAELDVALMLVDALDLMGAPVHASTLGLLDGAAVTILAVADQRTAGTHASVWLREPPPPRGFTARELETHAEHHRRRLRRLQERIAAACGRPANTVAADMRAGWLLDAEAAREYGLLDADPLPARGPAERPPGDQDRVPLGGRRGVS